MLDGRLHYGVADIYLSKASVAIRTIQGSVLRKVAVVVADEVRIHAATQPPYAVSHRL